MEKVLRDNGKFAFIMEKISSEYYAQNNCQFIHIGGLLNEKSYAIAMPKSKAKLLINSIVSIYTFNQSQKTLL